jgi:hypothetical protein
MQSDEIMNLENHKRAKESSELGRYEVNIKRCPQLKEGFGRALIDSRSMVSIMKESLEI